MFLPTIQHDAKALYILGDFIEYWIGDDDHRHGPRYCLYTITEFRSNKLAPIYLMHGNRDFCNW